MVLVLARKYHLLTTAPVVTWILVLHSYLQHCQRYQFSATSLALSRISVLFLLFSVSSVPATPGVVTNSPQSRTDQLGTPGEWHLKLLNEVRVKRIQKCVLLSNSPTSLASVVIIMPICYYHCWQLSMSVHSLPVHRDRRDHPGQLGSRTNWPPADPG